MTIARNGASIMSAGVAATLVAASATLPVESTEYVCGNNTAGQGLGGVALLRIYNQATTLGQGCTGILWGRYGTGDLWHPIGSMTGGTIAGTGTSGTATAAPTITGTNSGGAGAALPVAASTGLLVAGLYEQAIPFGPEWTRLLASFLGNTTGSVTVDAWIQEFETI